MWGESVNLGLEHLCMYTHVEEKDDLDTMKSFFSRYDLDSRKYYLMFITVLINWMHLFYQDNTASQIKNGFEI